VIEELIKRNDPDLASVFLQKGRISITRLDLVPKRIITIRAGELEVTPTRAFSLPNPNLSLV